MCATTYRAGGDVRADICPTMLTCVRTARWGGDPPSWPLLRATPSLKDIWQDHYSVTGTKNTNPPDDFIANLEPTDGGRLITVSAKSNGTFTVTNTRNGFSKTYNPKP